MTENYAPFGKELEAVMWKCGRIKTKSMNPSLQDGREA